MTVPSRFASSMMSVPRMRAPLKDKQQDSFVMKLKGFPSRTTRAGAANAKLMTAAAMDELLTTNSNSNKSVSSFNYVVVKYILIKQTNNIPFVSHCHNTIHYM